METRKLYYEDSHLTAFSAQVLRCTQVQKGWEVVLDATAFYPEGGGQAADTGMLGGVRVLHAKEANGVIVHLCDAPLKPGETVSGKIDWEPRFFRMQQHSGEHIVSGIIHKRFGFHNVGFHMGSERTTIDFDGVIPVEAIAEIEAEANAAIWGNIPLHIWTPSPEELETVSYRTKRALPWPVRIVEVPGFDTCACCGTHVTATGEIGLVKIFSAIPCRGGTRMEMACGKAAFAELSRFFEQNRRVSQLLSVPQGQTAEGTESLLSQMEEQKYRMAGMRRELNRYQAKDFSGKALGLCFTEGLDGNALRELAQMIEAECTGLAAVFSKAPQGYQYCLTDHGKSVQAVCKELNAALCGRGGGKPNFCQGSVQAEKAEIEAFFADRQWN